MSWGKWGRRARRTGKGSKIVRRQHKKSLIVKREQVGEQGKRGDRI